MNNVDKFRRLVTSTAAQTQLSRNRAAGHLLAHALDLNVGDILEIAAFALADSCADETARDVARIRDSWSAAVKSFAQPKPIVRQ